MSEDIEQTLRSEVHAVQNILYGLYLAGRPLFEIYDRLITPTLHHIGELWADGSITVTEEHLASQGIRDSLVRLQEIVTVQEQDDTRALCMNLGSELHDIAIKMVQHILEERGFQVLFSGQRTPAEKLDQIFNTYSPARVYISSTYVDELPAMQDELDRVLETSASFGALVFVGGRGFDILNYQRPVVRRRLKTFEEVATS